MSLLKKFRTPNIYFQSSATAGRFIERLSIESHQIFHRYLFQLLSYLLCDIELAIENNYR